MLTTTFFFKDSANYKETASLHGLLTNSMLTGKLIDGDSKEYKDLLAKVYAENPNVRVLLQNLRWDKEYKVENSKDETSLDVDEFVSLQGVIAIKILYALFASHLELLGKSLHSPANTVDNVTLVTASQVAKLTITQDRYSDQLQECRRVRKLISKHYLEAITKEEAMKNPDALLDSMLSDFCNSLDRCNVLLSSLNSLVAEGKH